MPSFQRDETYNNPANVLRGSAAIEVSPYQATPAWSPVGAQIGFTASRALETTEEEVDDADGKLTIFSDEWDVSFNRVETLTEAISKILYSFDTFTDVAGTLVSGATQEVGADAWELDKFIPIENQNGDGSALTVNSVNGSSAGSLVDGTDYDVIADDTGVYGIVVTASAIPGTDTLTINYDYTPNAHYTQENDPSAVDVPYLMIRGRAVNDDGKQMELTWYKCQLSETGELSFQSDNVEDRRLQEPLTFRAKSDKTYKSGVTFTKKVGESIF